MFVLAIRHPISTRSHWMYWNPSSYWVTSLNSLLLPVHYRYLEASRASHMSNTPLILSFKPWDFGKKRYIPETLHCASKHALWSGAPDRATGATALLKESWNSDSRKDVCRIEGILRVSRSPKTDCVCSVEKPNPFIHPTLLYLLILLPDISENFNQRSLLTN